VGVGWGKYVHGGSLAHRQDSAYDRGVKIEGVGTQWVTVQHAVNGACFCQVSVSAACTL
jgi:hypothetical protein